jgi:hypothetical protein
MSCRHCSNRLNVFDVGAGVFYELPCAVPGCMDSPPGDAYRVITPTGAETFDRVKSAPRDWRWERRERPFGLAARR